MLWHGVKLGALAGTHGMLAIALAAARHRRRASGEDK